ncbi:hypothetical protein Taro_017044 [Colocasia esculenta]|uniref:Uncharacterized protein n=1 Tax=Colocasia esculenta TaxID=4460 RepID=A0A843UQE3_COLES|nr:hypothetical protein [Colocasia esculenta]
MGYVAFLKATWPMSPSHRVTLDADPGLKPGHPSSSPSLAFFLSPSFPLALSEFQRCWGCLPRVEAAVLRRVSLRSCRGRVSLLSSGRARVGRRRQGGSRDACYSPSGSPGSVGGDRKNRVLGSLQRVTRTLKGQAPDVVQESDSDDEDDGDDEDSQAEPMDAQGDDDAVAEDQAPQDPAPSLRDFIAGQMAQLHYGL